MWDHVTFQESCLSKKVVVRPDGIRCTVSLPWVEKDTILTRKNGTSSERSGYRSGGDDSYGGVVRESVFASPMPAKRFGLRNRPIPISRTSARMSDAGPAD